MSSAASYQPAPRLEADRLTKMGSVEITTDN